MVCSHYPLLFISFRHCLTRLWKTCLELFYTTSMVFFFVVADGSKFQKWWFLISAFFSSLFLLGSRCTYVNVIWCKIKWSFRINTTHIREKYTLVNFECFKIGVIFDICWKNAVSGFDYESLWYLKRICKSTVVWLVIAKNNSRFLNNFK